MGFRIRRFVGGVGYYVDSVATITKGGEVSKEVQWTTNIERALEWDDGSDAIRAKERYCKRGEVVDLLGYHVSVRSPITSPSKIYSPTDPITADYFFAIGTPKEMNEQLNKIFAVHLVRRPHKVAH